MSVYTRRQVAELLEIEEAFVLALEREEIVSPDAAGATGAEFSEQMLERVRVAHNLVSDLEVNLAGVAIILRMREELADLRHQLEQVLTRMRSEGKEPGSSEG